MSASAITDTSDPSLALTDSDILTTRDADVDQDTPDTQSDTSHGYSSVSHATALQIIQIKRAKPDIEGKELAALVGVHPSTVSRWLKLLQTDTVPEARQLSRSQALRATMKLSDMVDHADPRVGQGAAKALVALAGVQEGSQPVQVGVQVVVGQVGQPAGDDPFTDAQIMVNSLPVINP